MNVRLRVTCWKLIQGCQWLHFPSLPRHRHLLWLKTKTRSFWPHQSLGFPRVQLPTWFQQRGRKVEGWVDPFYSIGCVWSCRLDPVLYSLLWQVNLTSSVPAMLTSCHQVQQVTTVWFTVPTCVIKTFLVNRLWMWRWETHPIYD